MRMCGLADLLQMRNGVFRHHEGAARVDVVHQVETLHVGLRRRRQADGAGVVDHDVEAAEGLDGFVDGVLDRLLVAHVHQKRQRLAARCFDLRRRRVDRARELGVRLGGLGRDDHVRAVPSRPKADGKADAARGAGDEERFAAKGHAVSSPMPDLPSCEEARAAHDTVLKALRADRDVLGKETAQRDPSRMGRIGVAARDERGCGERHVGKRRAALRQREQTQIRRRTGERLRRVHCRQRH